MRHLLLLTVLAVLVSSCAKNDPVAPTEPGFRVPAKGSEFELSGYLVAIGGTKVADSDFNVVETIDATDLEYGGKTGVWTVVQRDKASGDVVDTTYLCLDDKGDVLINFPDLSVDGSPRWLRLPINTGAVVLDSTAVAETYNGFPIEVSIKVKSERVGDESVTVGTTSLATKKITVTSTVSISALGQVVDSFSFTRRLWVAPSLGTIVQRSADAYEVAGEAEDGDFAKLVSYKLP